jgi:cytochrome b561
LAAFVREPEVIVPTPTKYPGSSRLLHWLTAIAVFGLVPIGIWMASRGAAGNFDALTNTLYSWHKLIGFTVLWIVVARIIIKLRTVTPPYPATMPRWQSAAAHGLHGLIYVLLLVVPLSGWAGVSAFPALVTVGGYNLPPMPFVPVNETLAKSVFQFHGAAAITLAVLVVGHIGAAVMHLIVFRDGVFQRMWFGR